MKSRYIVLGSLIVAALLCYNVGLWFGTKEYKAMASRPRNPQRPMRATNCQEAMARLHEAERGSPIIDKAQNKQHLMDAIDQAKRFCPEDMLKSYSYKKK